MISAMSCPEVFETCLTKWKELTQLTVEDVIRNSSLPIDYHMRVSENEDKSGFGQVDREGQLQGIGRECQDYIYEGQFKDNLFHGWGRYISEKGVYWGNFHLGMRHGRGKFVGHNGAVQEGNWNMGLIK